jgi:hypothetical protein
MQHENLPEKKLIYNSISVNFSLVTKKKFIQKPKHILRTVHLPNTRAVYRIIKTDTQELYRVMQKVILKSMFDSRKGCTYENKRLM